MHDHAHAHVGQVDEDLFVIDRHDRREDLTVQVKFGPTGMWHRKAVGGATTACGTPLGGYGTRPEEYSGALCPDCFTKFEIAQAVGKPDPHRPPSPLRRRPTATPANGAPGNESDEGKDKK